MATRAERRSKNKYTGKGGFYGETGTPSPPPPAPPTPPPVPQTPPPAPTTLHSDPGTYPSQPRQSMGVKESAPSKTAATKYPTGFASIRPEISGTQTTIPTPVQYPQGETGLPAIGGYYSPENTYETSGFNGTAGQAPPVDTGTASSAGFAPGNLGEALRSVVPDLINRASTDKSSPTDAQLAKMSPYERYLNKVQQVYGKGIDTRENTIANPYEPYSGGFSGPFGLHAGGNPKAEGAPGLLGWALDKALPDARVTLGDNPLPSSIPGIGGGTEGDMPVIGASLGNAANFLLGQFAPGSGIGPMLPNPITAANAVGGSIAQTISKNLEAGRKQDRADYAKANPAPSPTGNWTAGQDVEPSGTDAENKYRNMIQDLDPNANLQDFSMFTGENNGSSGGDITPLQKAVLARNADPKSVGARNAEYGEFGNTWGNTLSNLGIPFGNELGRGAAAAGAGIYNAGKNVLNMGGIDLGGTPPGDWSGVRAALRGNPETERANFRNTPEESLRYGGSMPTGFNAMSPMSQSPNWTAGQDVAGNGDTKATPSAKTQTRGYSPTFSDAIRSGFSNISPQLPPNWAEGQDVAPDAIAQESTDDTAGYAGYQPGGGPRVSYLAPQIGYNPLPSARMGIPSSSSDNPGITSGDTPGGTGKMAGGTFGGNTGRTWVATGAGNNAMAGKPTNSSPFTNVGSKFGNPVEQPFINPKNPNSSVFSATGGGTGGATGGGTYYQGTRGSSVMPLHDATGPMPSNSSQVFSPTGGGLGWRDASDVGMTKPTNESLSVNGKQPLDLYEQALADTYGDLIPSASGFGALSGQPLQSANKSTTTDLPPLQWLKADPVIGPNVVTEQPAQNTWGLEPKLPNQNYIPNMTDQPQTQNYLPSMTDFSKTPSSWQNIPLQGPKPFRSGGLVDKTKLGLDPEAYYMGMQEQPLALPQATGGARVGDLASGAAPAVESAPGGNITGPSVSPGPDWVWNGTQWVYTYPSIGGGDAGGGGDGGAGDGGGAAGDGGDGGAFMQGGMVTQGNPMSRGDDVPAMLQHGEYVVPRPAMQRLAEKTGGFNQAAKKVREMILKFASDGKSSMHFKETN